MSESPGTFCCKKKKKVNKKENTKKFAERKKVMEKFYTNKMNMQQNQSPKPNKTHVHNLQSRERRTFITFVLTWE